MRYLSAENILAIHKEVIGSHELQGVAENKSIEAIIARIDNRIAYGLITDVFELAACYACYIAVGHAFNDANKRTAFTSMDMCLVLNHIQLIYDTKEVGKLIIQAAQGIIDEGSLAQWLRNQYLAQQIING